METLLRLVHDFRGESARLKATTFVALLLSVFFISLSREIGITGTARMQVPLEVFVPLTALFAATGILLNRKHFAFSFTDLAVLLFLLAAGISAIFSDIASHSYKALLILCTYGATFYFSFRFLSLRPEQWQLVWRALMVSFLLLMLYTLFRYFNLGIHRQNSYEMSKPFIPGHTLLIAVGFPTFLYALNRLLRRVEATFNLFYVLLFSAITVISFSRIYWVMLLASAFVLVFYYIRRVRLLMIVSSVILIVAGTVAYHYIDAKRDRERAWDDPDDHNSLFVQIQSIFVWKKNESNIERSNRWKVAREIFRKHPFTGSGLNTYPDLYFTYKDVAGIEETHISSERMNCHQIYLGWLSDMGVIGFAAGLLLFSAFVALVIRLRGSSDFIFALLLFLNFVLLGLIEDYTTLEKIMAVFWVSLAYLYHLNAERKASS